MRRIDLQHKGLRKSLYRFATLLQSEQAQDAAIVRNLPEKSSFEPRIVVHCHEILRTRVNLLDDALSVCKSPGYFKHLAPVYTCDLGTGIVAAQYKGLDATARNKAESALSDVCSLT